jgi:hypothetical protein
MFRARKEIR